MEGPFGSFRVLKLLFKFGFPSHAPLPCVFFLRLKFYESLFSLLRTFLMVGGGALTCWGEVENERLFERTARVFTKSALCINPVQCCRPQYGCVLPRRNNPTFNYETPIISMEFS